MFTLTAMLQRAGRVFGSETAMVAPDGTAQSWADHVDRVARVAAVLAEHGIVRGKRFAILAPNGEEQCTLIHAGYWSGAVPVPLNFRLAAPELAAILKASDAGLLFIDPVFRAVLQAPDLRDWQEKSLFLDGPGIADDMPSLSGTIAQMSPLPPADCHGEDEALLLYTGGTTGQGKGVPLSHRNISANAMQITSVLRYRTNDRYLHVAPMFHSADLLATAVTMLGGSHAYLAKPTAEGFADTLETLQVTATMVPPSLLQAALDGGHLEGRDLSRLRVFISGGAPVSEDLLRRGQALLPNGSMFQGYGLTETSPILAFLGYRDALETGNGLSSIGRPLPGVDVRLVADDGNDARAGEQGELVVRGPNVMGGYLDEPGLTENVLRDGWFATGDVASMDADGFLTILDRKKDVIVTGAENVYSAEVETVLMQHPGVAECAVIGIPHETFGEAVFAIIVVAVDAPPEPDDLIDFCRRHIGGYKIPRRFAFVDALPRSPLGKILKNQLRQSFSEPGDG